MQSNVLPAQFTTFEDYADAVIKFLHKYSFLYNYFVYDDANHQRKTQLANEPCFDYNAEPMPVIDEERGIHFLLQKHWDRRLPQDWREFLATLDLATLSKIPSGYYDTATWPKSLCEFIEGAKQLAFVNQFADEPLVDNFNKKDKKEKILLKRMTPKKRHEVEILGKTVLEFAEEANCETIVDIGKIFV